MNAFVQFFVEDSALVARVECYFPTSRHSYDYVVSPSDFARLCALTHCAEPDLLARLNSEYPDSDRFISYFSSLGVSGSVANKRYEDSSSDV